VAVKLIGSLERHGLGLRQERNGIAADEAYLAAGYTAGVLELSSLRHRPR
jgi:hypothetical protein